MWYILHVITIHVACYLFIVYDISKCVACDIYCIWYIIYSAYDIYIVCGIHMCDIYIYIYIHIYIHGYLTIMWEQLEHWSLTIGPCTFNAQCYSAQCYTAQCYSVTMYNAGTKFNVHNGNNVYIIVGEFCWVETRKYT